MKKTRLKAKEVNRQLERYNLNLSKKDRVELLEDAYRLIIINGTPSFFYHKENIIPTLRYLQTHPDAIKFAVNGADIMRPGIAEIAAGIKKDDYVVIIDQNNHKPLAVGITLLNSEEMEKTGKGKVIRNIHYIGDEIWKMEF